MDKDFDALKGKEVTQGRPSKVTALNIKPEPTVLDDIVDTLEELLEAIKSGEIEPSHLILGYGQRTEVAGQPASSYLWDAVGLDVFQVIGHLNSYSIRLAMGEGHD